MRQIILFLCFISFLSFNATAQDYQIYGPEEGCVENPYTYFLERPTNPTDSIKWLVTEINGDTIPFNLLSNNSIEVSFPYSGEFVIEVILDGVVVGRFVVFIFGQDDINIAIESGCYARNPMNACLDVCIGEELLMYINTNDPNIIGDWEISGDADFNPNHLDASVIFDTPGTVTISFFSSQGQCFREASLCFNVKEKPEADFSVQDYPTADTIEVCPYEALFFINESNDAESYTWTMGDGTVYTSYEPTHTYQSSGVFQVTLYTDGICNCEDSKTITVIVKDELMPELSCASTTCIDEPQTYTLLNIDCDQVVWSISGNGEILGGGGIGEDSIRVKWNSGPRGIVTIDVSGCAGTFCNTTLEQVIPVISPSVTLEGDQLVCSGDLVTYTAPHFGNVEYTWSVSSQGQIIYNENTNYITVQWSTGANNNNQSVSVNYYSCFLDCGGTGDIQVEVTPELVVSGDTDACKDMPFSLTASQKFNGSLSPISADWEIYDENGSLVLSESSTSTWNFNINLPEGEYEVHVSNADLTTDICNGDEDIIYKILVYEAPPEPLSILGVDKICAGVPFAFTIENAGDFGTEWVVYDGATTTNLSGNQITYTFGATPPYRVEARHFNLNAPSCPSEYISLNLTEYTISDITGDDEVCEETTVSYTLPAQEGIIYNWSLDNPSMGEISTISNHEIELFFTESGVLTLTADYCTKTISTVITIHPTPTASVTHPANLCVGELGAVSSSQSVGTSDWYTAEGVYVTTGENVNLTPGQYVLTYTSINGCITKETFTINERESPIAELTSTDSPIYQTPTPDFNLVALYNPGYTYEWYKDGVLLSFTGTTYPVTMNGVYHVVVTNASGCSTRSNSITVLDCTTAGTCGSTTPGGNPCSCIPYAFNPAISKVDCRTHEISFDGTDVVTGTEQILIQNLATGALTLYNGQNPVSHTYDRTGYYKIYVYGEIQSFNYPNGACAHFATIIDSVEAIALYEYDNACNGEAVNFYNKSASLPSAEIISYSWDFGDPASGADNNSALPSPTHIFSAAGDYTVTLEITTSSGCITTHVETIRIPDPDVLQMQYQSDFCENEPALFYASPLLVDFEWEFGDPASGTENISGGNNVLHTYGSPGTYSVTLTGTTAYGCTISDTKSIEIHPNTLAGAITAAPDFIACEGDSIDLTSSPGGTSWKWQNSDTTEVITAPETGLYSVIVTDNLGCTYKPAPVFVEYIPKPAIQLYARVLDPETDYEKWESELTICHGEEVLITAFSDETLIYEWQDGNSGSSRSYTYEGNDILPPGTHTFTVYGRNGTTNCISDSTSLEVTVIAAPDKPVIAITSGNSCSFNNNILEVQNPQAGIVYRWSNGAYGQRIETRKAGYYTVVAMNISGCSIESDPVQIMPSALIDKLPAGCVYLCELDTMCLPQLSNVASYTIYLDGAVYSTGTTWQDFFVPTEFGVYTFEVTSPNGCAATSEPLALIFEPAFGDIVVPVYFDVDMNEAFNAPPDILIDDIVVNATHQSSGTIYTDTTIAGHVTFSQVPSGEYLITIDQTSLDSNEYVIIDSLLIAINFCDPGTDSVIIDPLLIGEKCTVEEAFTFEICPMDSVVFLDTVIYDYGTYTYVVDTGLCDTIYTITVDSFMLDELMISEVGKMFAGDTAFLTHNYVDSIQNTYIWTSSALLTCDSCITTYAQAPDTTFRIYLEMETPEGCILRDFIDIEIEENQIYFPNAFSPNGDEVNDYFRPLAGVPITDATLVVYDRWGNKVFETYSKDGNFNGWNGMTKGQESLPDVYVYSFSGVVNNGEKITATGEITLLR